MRRPYSEYLQIHEESDGAWIACGRCSVRLGRWGEDWKKSCKRALLPPEKAGPLMRILSGRYLFEKIYCPGCGTLLDADMVEAEARNEKAYRR